MLRPRRRWSDDKRPDLPLRKRAYFVILIFFFYFFVF